MKFSEEQINEKLQKICENYPALGIKVEFESETADLRQNLYLKEISTKYKLDFVLKLGGLSSVKDIDEAKFIGADSLVAPMVESSYSLEKYVKSANMSFEPKLYINIETKNAISNLDEIIESDSFKALNGVVIGRSDLSDSLNIKPTETLKIICKAIDKLRKTHAKIGLGGSISPDSYEFLRKVDIDFFETRKLIFDSKLLNNEKKASGAIIEAIEFELLWLEYRQSSRHSLANSEKLRFDELRSRCVYV